MKTHPSAASTASDTSDVEPLIAQPTWKPLSSAGHPRRGNRTKMILPILGGFGAGIVALMVVAFMWWRQTAQAEVVVTFTAKPLVETVELTLDPTLTVSQAENRRVAAQTVTKSVSGEATVPSTGTKAIGDPAQGKVTLINKTDSSKTFASGTVLSSGTLKFSVSEGVTVPAASVSAQNSESQTKTFGKAEAKVVAAKIGEEGNLKKDTQFKVGDFADSSFLALATADFSGGSSREVKVVTEKDRQKVTQELTTKLLKEAETALKQELPSGRSLVLSGKQKTDQATFDVKAGDEAETVSLKLALTVEALTYENAELRPLAQAILAPRLASGYELGPETPGILSTPIQSASGSGSVAIKAELSAQTYPQFDAESWKREIAGKSIQAAQTMLRAKSEVKAVEVHIVPVVLQKVLPWLPPSVQHITITRQAKS